MGMNFGNSTSSICGPDVLQIIQSLPRDALPHDIRSECFDSIKAGEGAKAGDWIAIWGGKQLPAGFETGLIA